MSNVAYHFYKNNPADPIYSVNIAEKVRVPASEICHYYKPARAGQVRGIPRAHTGQSQMRQLDEYEYAELERKKNSSAIYGWIKSSTNNALNGLNGVTTFGEDTSAAPAPTGSTDPNLIIPGSIAHLYPDEDLQFNRAADTDPNYESYIRNKKRSAATAMGMAYASYSGDLSDNSYSGIRAGQNQEETKYRLEQEFFISKVKNWMWKHWFDTAVLAGVLQFANYCEKIDEYQAVIWQPQGWKYINPLQEINAMKVELELGIISSSQAAASRGRDYSDVAQQIADEKALRKKLGIPEPALKSNETEQKPDDTTTK